MFAYSESCGIVARQYASTAGWASQAANPGLAVPSILSRSRYGRPLRYHSRLSRFQRPLSLYVALSNHRVLVV